MAIYEQKRVLEEERLVVESLHDLTKKVKAEDRLMTPEEQQHFDGLLKKKHDYEERLQTIQRFEAAEQLQPSELRITGGRTKPTAPIGMITNQDREWALRGYLLHNAGKFDLRAKNKQRPEYVECMEKVGLQPDQDYKINFNKNIPFWYPPQMRAQELGYESRTFNGQTESTYPQTVASSGGSTGGFLADQSILIRELTVFTKWYSGMYMASTIRRTDDTGVMAYKPTLDDTANAASLHSEYSQMDGLDAAFSHKDIPAYVYDTFLEASVELLNDSRLNLEEIISSEICAVRIARKENTDYTVGSGSGAPLGVKTDIAANGTTYTSAASGTFIYADINAAQFTPDWSYVQDESCAWMLSQSGYKNMWGLVDSQNRPLMNMSMDLIAPRDRLDGRPVIINNDFDSFAAGNTFGAFGAWRFSEIRNVDGLQMRTLRERFIYDNLAVGFAAWKRAGYRLMNQKSIILLKVHA